MYVVTLPAFQRCLEDGPDAAERGDQREGADSPPAGGLETAISRHITTYRQHRRDPGRQPGVKGSIVPAASRTSYSSFLKVGVRDLFSATEKNKRSRFDSAQPNDTSNTNDLCLECVARSLLKLYRQQHGASFHYFFRDEGTAPRPHQSKWWNALLSQRESFCTSRQEIRFGI